MELKAQIKDLTWDSRKRETRITLSSESLPDALEGFKGDLRVKIEEWHEKRSLDANAMFWACVGQIASKLREDKDDIYKRLLRAYGLYEVFETSTAAYKMLSREFRVVEEIGEVSPGKSQFLCYYGSSYYDTKDFAVLLDGAVREMKDLKIAPPPSEDMQRALEKWEQRHEKSAAS